MTYDYKNIPITVSSYHTTKITYANNQVIYSQPIDRLDEVGGVITIDLFHPDLYKINAELALWSHFILTGENPAQNTYMNDIITNLNRLSKKEKEAIYMHFETQGDIVNRLKKQGTIETLANMLKLGLTSIEALKTAYSEDIIKEVEDMATM